MRNEVTLRNVRETDLPAFFEHQRDPVAWHMAAFSSRDHASFMAHWKKIMAGPALHLRAVLLDGELVGNISCFERQGLHEVGYWIAREHWGKGIATRALAQFLREIPFCPLHAFVVSDNIGSIRVLEKNGFRVLRREKLFMEVRGGEVEEFMMILA